MVYRKGTLYKTYVLCIYMYLMYCTVKYTLSFMQAISSPDLVYFFFSPFFSLSDWDFGCGGLGPCL